MEQTPIVYAIGVSINTQLSVDWVHGRTYHAWMQFKSLQSLFELIERLRGPDGCPWDQVQGFDDVVSDIIEEAYELEWAATRLGDTDVLDEIGDVLFLLCFAVSIRRETDPAFTLDRIASKAYEKIYSRHPHVFGDASASSPEESLVHWEEMKARERTAKNKDGGVLDGVAGNLPPLRRAEKIQERAASVGFDWDDTRDVVAKIREELDELEHAIDGGKRDEIQHEIGDLFFSVVNVARFLKFDPGGALNRTTSRFISRFETMEHFLRTEGKKLPAMTLEEMDAYWNRAKKEGPAG